MVNIVKTITTITAILTLLKLTGDISISWWLVTCLMWFPTAVVLFIIFVLLVVSFNSLNGTTRKLKRGRK